MTAGSRIAKIERKTKETDIALEINLDGTGESSVSTGIGFFDHMLTALAKHGLFDLSVKAKGDLEIDQHHLIEDLGIVLGMAVEKALGDKKGIGRSGSFAFPMDETLSVVSIDFSGRARLNFDAAFEREFIGEMQSDLVKEFFAGFVQGAKCNLHVRVLYSGNDHHKCEGIFKGFAKALMQACAINPRVAGKLPSTKGMIQK
jgi:imidazoleglycerol-phosphate dehydratase